MSEGFISRGFRGRREPSDTDGRLPPGQYLERGFPVLSAGPTQHTPLANWDFSLIGEVDQPKRWSWEEFRALPRETVTKDIHCVTKWSKFDLAFPMTFWQGLVVNVSPMLLVSVGCARCVGERLSGGVRGPPNEPVYPCYLLPLA